MPLSLLVRGHKFNLPSVSLYLAVSAFSLSFNFEKNSKVSFQLCILLFWLFRIHCQSPHSSNLQVVLPRRVNLQLSLLSYWILQYFSCFSVFRAASLFLHDTENSSVKHISNIRSNLVLNICCSLHLLQVRFVVRINGFGSCICYHDLLPIFQSIIRAFSPQVTALAAASHY